MIDFFDIKQDEELEKASETVSERIYINSYLMQQKEIPEYEFLLIALSEEGFFSCNHTKKWTQAKDSKYWHNAFSIRFNELPEDIKYIEVFLNNSNSSNCFEDIVMQFQKEINNNLFSYHQKNFKNHKHMFCGTFAKVSDGWKFYPYKQ